MERTFSIFIATDELFTSPFIQNYARLFDTALQLNTVTLVSFVVPLRRQSAEMVKRLHIQFDPDILEIHHGSIYTYAHDAHVAVTLALEPRDIGITHITLEDTASSQKQSEASYFAPQLIRNTVLNRNLLG